MNQVWDTALGGFGMKEDRETWENQNMGHGSGSNTVPKPGRGMPGDLPVPVILASQSPSRRSLLLDAGIRPAISVSHVDEDAALDTAAQELGTGPGQIPAPQRVQILADAKAFAVAQVYSNIHAAVLSSTGDIEYCRPFGLDAAGGSGSGSPGSVLTRETLKSYLDAHPGLAASAALYGAGPVIIGSDSLFETCGDIYGKPHTPETARLRLQQMRGVGGVLWTGHTVIDQFTGKVQRAVSRSAVRFADYTDDDIDSYIATGEPLEVAGCFTLEGIGSAFISSVEGSPSGVMGLSIPHVKKLVNSLGLEWRDLWNMAKSRGTQEQGSRDYLSGQDRRAAAEVPDDNITQPGDGWIPCVCGHKHWGLNGAAGVMLVRTDPGTGRPTHIVMQHRAVWSAEGGTWGIPGGALSDGENAVEGALRESWEEAGIPAGDIQVIGAYCEDHGPWSYTTVIAREKPGCRVEPYTRDDESSEIRWIPVDKIPDIRLLSAFRHDWPYFSQLIGRLTAEGTRTDTREAGV